MLVQLYFPTQMRKPVGKSVAVIVVCYEFNFLTGNKLYIDVYVHTEIFVFVLYVVQLTSFIRFFRKLCCLLKS